LSRYWTIEYNCWMKLLIKVCEIFFYHLVLSATAKQYFRYIAYCWKKPEFPNKNLWPVANDWQIVLRNVVSTAQSHALESLIAYERLIDWWWLTPQYFSYIVAVRFIGGGNRRNRRNRRKSPNCHW
jgi:hypothetical protein